MISSPKLVLTLASTLALCHSARTHELDCGRVLPTDAKNHRLAESTSSVSSVPQETGGCHQTKVTRFDTRFDGDHSLEAMTVDEQFLARYTLYKLHLQFASGAEQSIAIMAPPGGLQPELRDMSGDSVPNDVVLNSSLLHAPLIILVNDGHDHLTVAASPTSLGCDEGRALGPYSFHRLFALRAPGFKSAGHFKHGELFPPETREQALSSVASVLQNYSPHSSRSGRAPPAFAAIAS